ncbi:MAG TPA: histidine kinase [Bryobacteraceae bacterium]|nr:histidine kinase [Bryobacteraceae bacterium]
MRPPTRVRTSRWPWYLLAWTLIVLFYSTTAIAHPHPDWLASFKAAVAQWGVWALLSLLIVRVDRQLPIRRDELIKRLLFHIPLALLFTAVFIYLHAATVALLSPEHDFKAVLTPSLILDSLGGMLHWNVLVYCAIVGVYSTLEYYGQWRDRQLRAVELERLLSESRLENLRAQLHPHFLFNALNAISAYIDCDARVAHRMLEKLGELLRMSLEHADGQEVPLERELAFVERYLELQRARFEDRLEVTMNIDPGVRRARVPAFLLQPLVENAIRHGISARPDTGLVELSAWRENGHLRLRVRDDGPGISAAWDPRKKAGVGIANTRERLRNLYGDHGQRLEIHSEPGHGVRVEISLPFAAEVL